MPDSQRARIRESLAQALHPLSHVIAFWEQGSLAMGRTDQWSDLDLQVLIRNGFTAETFQAIELGLSQVAPTARTFDVPPGPSEGNTQAFYQLEGLDPHLQVDICVIEERSTVRYLEPEIHGTAQVIFDKEGAVVQPATPAGPQADRIRQRLPRLEVPMEMFHIFVEKELRRGRSIDAFHFYHGVVLTRLVEALRIRYCPWRYNFGYRYLHQDLPRELAEQVEWLLYVGGPEELGAKKEAAVALLRETLIELKGLDIEALLEETR